MGRILGGRRKGSEVVGMGISVRSSGVGEDFLGLGKDWYLVI